MSNKAPTGERRRREIGSVDVTYTSPPFALVRLPVTSLKQKLHLLTDASRLKRLLGTLSALLKINRVHAQLGKAVADILSGCQTAVAALNSCRQFVLGRVPLKTLCQAFAPLRTP